MRRPHLKLSFGLLSALLLLGAVLALAVALVFLNRSHSADADAEVGKWLLTVAAAFVFTGALSLAVKAIDQRRSERQAWHGVLRDLGAVNQTVGMVRFRLKSNKSAQTYQEQLPELVRARLEIRRIYAIDIVYADECLRAYIEPMKDYLDELGQECVTGHLRVARQQRLDELWLTERMKDASNGPGAPELPHELECPTEAWHLLTNQSQFPRLVALLDDCAFKIDAFRTNYKLAKGDLERKAGFEARSTKALAEAAQKLICRSEDFNKLHQGTLSRDIVKCIKEGVCEVQKACHNNRRRDIEKAIDGLGKAVASAIRAVYSLRNGTATQEREAPPVMSAASSLSVDSSA